jgi:hypothetical protein
VRLKSRYHGNKFPFIPLDSFDLDLGGGFAFGVPGLGGSSFGFLFGGILGRLFASAYG